MSKKRKRKMTRDEALAVLQRTAYHLRSYAADVGLARGAGNHDMADDLDEAHDVLMAE